MCCPIRFEPLAIPFKELATEFAADTRMIFTNSFALTRCLYLIIVLARLDALRLAVTNSAAAFHFNLAIVK